MQHNCKTARLERISAIQFYCQILVARINVMLCNPWNSIRKDTLARNYIHAIYVNAFARSIIIRTKADVLNKDLEVHDCAHLKESVCSVKLKRKNDALEDL